MNLFSLSASEYRNQRSERMDIMQGFREQNALYISRMRNIPYDTALDFIDDNLGEGKRFNIDSPKILFAHSPTRGNKELAETTLWEYAKDVLDKDFILTPSLTSYVPPEILESPITPFLIEQRANRDVLKEKERDAEQDGDIFGMLNYNSQQNTAKRFQNSVSGANLVASTTLYNATGHSSLTSGCFGAVSYTNANNERFIGGIRHYHTPDVTIAALLTSMLYDPLDKVKAVVEKYKLAYPTKKDVMQVIWRSTRYNWRSSSAMVEIEKLVLTMTEVERASFVYGSDLHHLEQLNPEFVKWIIFEPFRDLGEVKLTQQEASDAIKNADEDMVILARYICSDEMAGKKWKDVKSKFPELYRKVGQITKHIHDMMLGLKDVIEAFWQPAQLHLSIARFPSMLRTSVALSDTDSSVAVAQAWILKYCPNDWFSKTAYNIGYVISYLFTQKLVHLLAMYTSNLGISEKYIFRIKMKNEFYFPLTAITQLAKHYYGLASAQEGSVKANMDFILKGVNLRGSTSSRLSAQALESYVRFIMDKIMYHGGLTLEEALTPVLDFYNNIIADITGGGYKFLRSLEVKEAENYTKGENDVNVKNRYLWEKVFAPAYGPAPDPPYGSVSMSVTVKNKSHLAAWIESMADKDLGERMHEFVTKNMGGKLTTLRLPEQSIRLKGIPKEVLSILDVRKITTTIMLPFYLVLETLGIYFKNDKLTRIIADEWRINLPGTLDDSSSPVHHMEDAVQ